jgi:type IV secretory pathway TraG/TraD family ATPase VirD4
VNDQNATGMPDPLHSASVWLHQHLSQAQISAHWPMIVAAFAGLIGLTVLTTRRSDSAPTAFRNRRADGQATSAVIRKVASRRAMRRQMTVLRPSLAKLSRWERRWVPVTEYATALARVRGKLIWSSIEDVTLRVGGPRTGKTGELACRILDAPGAVIVTSTRDDLVKIAGRLRADRGPVRIFNPGGHAGLESTFTFDPLTGCQNLSTAAHRAADLLGARAKTGDAERDHWDTLARSALTALLYAAAVGQASMRDVQSWFTNPDAALPIVTRHLQGADDAVRNDATAFLNLNDKTRSSISSQVMPALQWLSDPTAAAAASAGALDVAELLHQRATVFLLGGEDANLAPLVGALTGHIAREARRIAATMPGGRLDPPLTLALDEAALICPVPLDNWTADMGGRNITIHIAAQSRAQLRQRFGDRGAATIVTNAATVLVFGGTGDADDLDNWSKLAGERLETYHTRDSAGKITATSTRRIPVLTPAEIAELPAGHVLVVRRGLPTTLGTVQMAWQRRDVRAAERRARKEQRLACRVPTVAAIDGGAQ